LLPAAAQVRKTRLLIVTRSQVSADISAASNQ